MYFYKSHLGGLYTSNKKYKDSDLYCDECGDSDDYLGKYDSWIDFIKRLTEQDYDYMWLSVEYLCEEAQITEEQFKELNPAIYEYEKSERYLDDED